MLSSPYLQHALYSLACLSVSINLVGMRRSAEEDKSRVEARMSLLASVKEQLSKEGVIDSKELERLLRLATKTAGRETDKDKVLGDDVSWGDIFSAKTSNSGKEEMSKWDKADLEKFRNEIR